MEYQNIFAGSHLVELLCKMQNKFEAHVPTKLLEITRGHCGERQIFNAIM